MSRYKLLDAFRGLAILWIICFHLLAGRNQYGVLLNYIIRHGYLGVQMFLVISGFGIAASISCGKYRTPLSFLLPRFKRIYLPYWWHLLFAALIIPVLSAMVYMVKSHSFNIGFVKYSILEWFQIITLTKVFSGINWKLNLPFEPLNGVLWYIAIIIQIYLFVSICLCFKKYNFVLFCCFWLSMMTNISIIKGLIPYGIFLPYFAQFYVGIIVYYILHDGYVPDDIKSIIFMMLLCLVSVSYCAYTKNELLPLSFAFLTGFIFIVLHKYDEKLSNLYVVKLLILIGTFSYSLYLMHVPLMPLVGMITRNIFQPPFEFIAPFASIIEVIILSFIWYLFFEKPATQHEIINRMFNPIRSISSGMKDLLPNLAKKKQRI